MRFNKKGQEEIVGFVAIVLIVAVIALIFLGISLRNDSSQIKDSLDLRRFIDSSLAYTSDCALGYEPNYASLKDLMADCHNQAGKTCLDQRNVCQALNETIKGILNASWQVGPSSKINAYDFKTTYSINATDSKEEEIVHAYAGNCTSNIYTEGSSFFSVYPGTVTSTLRVCYAPTS